MGAAAAAVAAMGTSAAFAQDASIVLGSDANIASAQPPDTRVLSFGLAAAGVYNSNVAGVNAATAAKEGLTPGDEILSPAVTADIVWPVGPESVFLHGSAGYNFYAHNTILNSQDIDIRTGLNAKVDRCSGKVTAAYTSNQSNLNELTISVVRNVESDESIAVSAWCPRQVGLVPAASLSEAAAQNSNPIQDPSNFDTFKATVGVGYTQPMFGVLSLYGVYDDTEFPNRMPADGYNLYGVGIRYDRRLGARIEAVGSLSYCELDPELADEPRFSGPTYSLDGTFRATGKIKAHVRLERLLEPALQLNTTYDIQEIYLAEAVYAMSSRLSATIGVSQENDDYRGGALIPAVDVTHQTLNDVYASASLDVGRRLVLVFDLREERRSANLLTYDYTSTRVGLTARVKL
jgi:hypothetical protein